MVAAQQRLLRCGDDLESPLQHPTVGLAELVTPDPVVGILAGTDAACLVGLAQGIDLVERCHQGADSSVIEIACRRQGLEPFDGIQAIDAVGQGMIAGDVDHGLNAMRLEIQALNLVLVAPETQSAQPSQGWLETLGSGGQVGLEQRA